MQNAKPIKNSTKQFFRKQYLFLKRIKSKQVTFWSENSVKDEGGVGEPAPHPGRERNQESPEQVEDKVRLPLPGPEAEQHHGDGHHRRGPHPQLQSGQAPGDA